MAGLFLFYSLSMFGATNWLLPESALKRLSSFGGSGIKGAFLMGLVSGLIASPCTGPVLAFILTLISGQGDIGTGSILMISFGLGMGLPFLILGTFSSVLARIPRSGAWLNRIKVAFGLVMLSSSIYFFQLGLNGLLKSQNQDSGFEASLNWLHIGQQENALDKLEKILQIYKDQGFPVLIDFYASWCIACGELEKLTFQDPEVSKALKDFKLIRIDLSIETATLKLIEKKFGIVGLPLVVFYNRKGVLLENPKIYGFMDSKAFLKLLEDLKKSPGL